MVVDAIAEIEAQNPQPVRSKSELVQKWIHLRQNVLSIPKEEIISDIKNAKDRSPSLPAIQDLSQGWNLELVIDPDGRKGFISKKDGQEVELGLESLKAGLNFEVPEEGTANHLLPYPEFDEKGEYRENISFVVKVNEAQFQQIQSAESKK